MMNKLTRKRTPFRLGFSFEIFLLFKIRHDAAPSNLRDWLPIGLNTMQELLCFQLLERRTINKPPLIKPKRAPVIFDPKTMKRNGANCDKPAFRRKKFRIWFIHHDFSICVSSAPPQYKMPCDFVHSASPWFVHGSLLLKSAIPVLNGSFTEPEREFLEAAERAGTAAHDDVAGILLAVLALDQSRGTAGTWLQAEILILLCGL